MYLQHLTNRRMHLIIMMENNYCLNGDPSWPENCQFYCLLVTGQTRPRSILPTLVTGWSQHDNVWYLLSQIIGHPRTQAKLHWFLGSLLSAQVFLESSHTISLVIVF